MDTQRQLVEDATDAAFSVAVDTAEAGEGLCLVTSAILGRALADRGVDVQVVVGSFSGAPHWWLVWGDWIIDATRLQFDDGDLITRDHRLYHPGEVFPIGWTDQQLVMEAQRAFQYSGDAQRFVIRMQNRIRDALREPVA